MISRYEVSRVVNDALKENITRLHPFTNCFNLDPDMGIYTSVQY
jgi:hypothetical protein